VCGKENKTFQGRRKSHLEGLKNIRFALTSASVQILEHYTNKVALAVFGKRFY